MISILHEMITHLCPFHRNFAANLNESDMPKTKSQETAMDFAMSYEDMLLRIEGILRQNVEAKRQKTE